MKRVGCGPPRRGGGEPAAEADGGRPGAGHSGVEGGAGKKVATPAERREAVGVMQEAPPELSERRACELADLDGQVTATSTTGRMKRACENS